MIEIKRGNYLSYPCVNGCGHHMRLKDEIDDLEAADQITLECPDCNQKKKYSAAELTGIVNSNFD